MNRFTESLVKYAAPFALASTVAACDDTVNQDFNLPDRVETADAGNIHDIQNQTLRTASNALIDPTSGDEVSPTILNGSDVYIYCDTPTNGPTIVIGSLNDSPLGYQYISSWSYK